MIIRKLQATSFAIDDFEFRKDWEDRREKFVTDDLLSVVTATEFLVAFAFSFRKKKQKKFPKN